MTQETRSSRGFALALVVGTGLAGLCGCTSYTPLDFDLDRFAREWSERTASDETVAAFAAALDDEQRAGFDPSDGLSRAEAEIVALAYNPSLAVTRLETVGAEDAADVAGRWADPTLGVDVLRFLEATDEPWLLAGALDFVIPISGSKGAERRHAEAEAAEARATLREVEHALLTRLGAHWIAWWSNARRLELVDAAKTSLNGVIQIAERLERASAITRSDRRLLELEALALDDRRTKLAADVARSRRELLGLLGLAPDAPVTLHAAPAIGDPAITTRGPAELRDHPRLKRLEARLATADRQLRRELAKQYPDLTIGPRVEDEEGQTRLGLGLGIPLPLWNRNRHGIATATAARAAAAAAVEAEFVRLISAHRGAEIDRAQAIDRRAALERDLVALTDRHVAEQRRIAELGDLDVIRLADAFGRALAAKERLLDAAIDVTEANHRIQVLRRRAADERSER